MVALKTTCIGRSSRRICTKYSSEKIRRSWIKNKMAPCDYILFTRNTTIRIEQTVQKMYEACTLKPIQLS